MKCIPLPLILKRIPFFVGNVAPYMGGVKKSIKSLTIE